MYVYISILKSHTDSNFTVISTLWDSKVKRNSLGLSKAMYFNSLRVTIIITIKGPNFYNHEMYFETSALNT